jgi:hypothetical protein
LYKQDARSDQQWPMGMQAAAFFKGLTFFFFFFETKYLTFMCAVNQVPKACSWALTIYLVVSVLFLVL